jgi:hypothetical protein
MLPDESGLAGAIGGPAAIGHCSLTIKTPILRLSVAEILAGELEGSVREEGRVRRERRMRD